MAFHIVLNDIVNMETDAVVNAANSALRPGGGVCGAIFRAAGYEKLDMACRSIGCCAEGDAVITPGFELKAPWIIHAVGPRWQGGGHGEAKTLRSAYMSALTLAADKGLASVSFPLISAGIFGYPGEEAMEIACRSISSFLQSSDMDVYLVLLDRAADRHMGDAKFYQTHREVRV